MSHLLFDKEKYEVRTCEIEDRAVIYRAFEGITYCEHPADEIQKLNLFAPEEYFHGGEINGYTLDTAPIFIPNSVGGYMPGPCEQPGRDRRGHVNVLFYALAHGYVVASIGVRGRTTPGRAGKAPSFVVDMKAGIRYLRKNKDLIPGNTDHMITSGTSAGGALSALTGASGNHPDYDSYLEKIGAAKETDEVFASNCYCPIHNLEHADMAYEWLFGDVQEYHGIKMEMTPEGMKFTPSSGYLTEEQIGLSRELKGMFPDYVNRLALRDDSGNLLTLEKDGSGSFRELVKEYIRMSAQRALRDGKKGVQPFRERVPGCEVTDHPALTIENDTVVAVDLDAYVNAITRMKQTPAFDDLSLLSPENDVFGTADADAHHFTDFAVNHSKAGGTKAEDSIIRRMNPLTYIDDAQADTAKYWRIRHGSYDRDTSLAIPVILATKLKNCGQQVDFHLPWGIPHRGDYDLEELFAWIDGITHKR